MAGGQGQHPNSIRAWNHNALRGSHARVSRGSRHHFISIIQSSTTTPQAKSTANQILQLMDVVTVELKTRKD